MAEITGTTEKKVNLYAMVPVTNLKIPRIGRNLGIRLTVNEIRECLRAKARVEEIIGNKVIPLGFHNFNIDNSIERVISEEPPVFNKVTPDGKITPADIDAAKIAAEHAILNTEQPAPVTETDPKPEDEKDEKTEQGSTTEETEKEETPPVEETKPATEDAPEVTDSVKETKTRKK